MNVRLVLASAPVSLEDRYGKFSGAANTQASFGLTCLAAVARDADCPTKIIEASALNLSVKETADQILEFKPDIVGITATTVGIFAAGALAEKLKKSQPELIIIIGGPHASAIPTETLEQFPDIDLAVIGEGEHTLMDILKNIDEDTGSLSGISGTAERINGEVKLNTPRDINQDLDSFPLPAWSLLEGFPDAYHPSPARIRRWPCASIVLTRGCPNRCTFCDRSVFGNKCRSYSPAYAAKLLKDLRYNFGVKEILIEDDTFIIQKQNVIDLCEIIIRDKIDITWSCLGRADRVDPDLLKLMKKAGCWHISYGIESGSQEILKKVNKHLDLEQIRNALIWSKQAGLKTKGFFIIGFPEETPESLAKTKALALDLPISDISVMQMTPFPGSEIYACAVDYGTFDCNWKKMNALNTVFVPNGFTKEDLEQTRSEILRAFYLRPRIIKEQIVNAIKNPRLIKHIIAGFITFLKATRK